MTETECSNKCIIFTESESATVETLGPYTEIEEDNIKVTYQIVRVDNFGREIPDYVIASGIRSKQDADFIADALNSRENCLSDAYYLVFDNNYKVDEGVC